MTRTLLATLALSGCSFAVVKGPPSNPAATPTDRIAHCTSSSMPMIADIGLTALTFYTAASIMDEATNWEGDGLDKAEFTTYATVGLAATGAFIASAIWGYRTSARCNTYQLEQAARIQGGRVATP